jgi:hypothetical protein
LKDLRQLLEKSELVEQKVFLKSFVERIEVRESGVKVIYAFPLPSVDVAMQTVRVLLLI